MISLSRLFGRFDKRKQIVFAEDAHTSVEREAIDEFLVKVLPEEEREFIKTSFISDEATLLDCSLAEPGLLKSNCKAAYGVDLSTQELKLPLHILVSHVRALKA